MKTIIDSFVACMLACLLSFILFFIALDIREDVNEIKKLAAYGIEYKKSQLEQDYFFKCLAAADRMGLNDMEKRWQNVVETCWRQSGERVE